MASNNLGFTVPDFRFWEDSGIKLYDRGCLYVNLNSKFDVFDADGVRCGGIYNNESYVIIGRIGVATDNKYGNVIVFTNGAGQPTIGYTMELGNGSPWSLNFHKVNSDGDGVFKTYNRTINFFGYNCDPGTYVAPTLFKKSDLDFHYAWCDSPAEAVTLPLTDLSRANTISIKSAVINGNVVSAPRLSSLSYPDNEYAIIHVTDKGTNCDIEGKW